MRYLAAPLAAAMVFALAAGMSGLACGSAQAATISYQMTGQADYTLGGDAHSGLFEVLGIGDTTGVIDLPNPPFRAGDRANGTLPFGFSSAPFHISITLSGLGAFDVIGDSYLAISPFFSSVQFGSGAGDFIYFIAPELVTYDLASSLGPLAGGGLGSYQSVLTSGGTLQFGAISSAAFSSVTAGVPEPASWAMMLIGFSGVGLLLRRRRSRAALAV